MELALELQKSITEKEIPAFKSTLTKLIAELSNKSRTPDSLAAIVEKDPVLSCRVLRLVNSPMYKPFGRNIYDVKRALNILGEDSLYNLLTQIPVMRENLLEDDIAIKTEYVKSATCVELSKKVLTQKELPFTDREFAYAAMHRYGYVALASFYPEIWHSVKLEVSAGSDVDSALLSKGLSKKDIDLAVFDGVEVCEDMPADCITVINMASTISDKIYESSLTAELIEDFSSALGISTKMLESAIDASKKAVLQALDTSKDVLGIEQHTTDLSTAMLLAKGTAVMRKQFELQNVIDYAFSGLDLLANSLETSRAILFLAVNSEIKAVKGIELGTVMPPKSIQFLKSNYENNASLNTFELCLKEKKQLFLTTPKKLKHPVFWNNYFGDAKELLLIPLFTSEKAIGLIYLDWKTASSQMWMTDKVKQGISEVSLLLNKKLEAETARIKK